MTNVAANMAASKQLGVPDAADRVLDVVEALKRD